MSAACQNAMSALPPKADMCGALSDVRFVPKADMSCEIAGIGKPRIFDVAQNNECSGLE